MGFFGKKEEKRLPELPSSRESKFSNFEEGLDNEKHSLPTFPDSPSHNKFSEAMIKEAVSMKEEKEILPKFSQDKKDIKIVEMEEWQPSAPMETENNDSDEDDEEDELDERFMPPEEKSEKKFAKLPKLELPESEPRRDFGSRTQLMPEPNFNKELGRKEIFVKIDKYHTARKSISEIAAKLEEIDDTVRKIREVKLREEQELASWEKDILHAKTRIHELNENIFGKTDEI